MTQLDCTFLQIGFTALATILIIFLMNRIVHVALDVTRHLMTCLEILRDQIQNVQKTVDELRDKAGKD